MPKVTDATLKRVHIQVNEEDWDALLVFFGNSTKRSAVIREILHDFVKHTYAKAEQRINLVRGNS